MIFDNILKKYKSSESLISMVLGVVIVLLIGNQVIGFISNKTTTSNDPTSGTVETTSDQPADNSTYLVQKGDYLYLIAAKLLNDGNRWLEIAKLNNITNPNIITEGDRLVMPEIAKTETVTDSEIAKTETVVEAAAKQDSLVTADKYTVQANDSLWKICIRAYGDGYQWPKLAKANNLKNPDVLEKGQILMLPR